MGIKTRQASGRKRASGNRNGGKRLGEHEIRYMYNFILVMTIVDLRIPPMYDVLSQAYQNQNDLDAICIFT